VRVAASQSNTVKPDTGPGRNTHKHKVSLKSDASLQANQEYVSKSSSVDMSKSKLSGTEGVKSTGKKQEPAVSTSKERIKLKSRSKLFEINTLPGGKFGLLLKSSARSIDKVTGNEHNSEILGGQKQFYTSARKQFRGENDNNETFNNIPVIRNTPTKRKMDFTVVNEVGVYSGSPCANLPGQDNGISSESPAKRQKWGQ
jgi:hypothetical protein